MFYPQVCYGEASEATGTTAGEATANLRPRFPVKREAESSLHQRDSREAIPADFYSGREDAGHYRGELGGAAGEATG